MNRFSFHLLSGAVLAFVFSLFTAPVLAQETFAYPQDFPPRVLQMVGDAANSVAPTGSNTGKSASLSGNSVTLNSGTIGNSMSLYSGGSIYGAINLKDLDVVTSNRVTINGGTVVGAVYGGQGLAVSGNSVVVNNGFAKSWVIGGLSQNTSGEAAATNNSVVINGGATDGVFGGYADSYVSDDLSSNGNASASNNSVVISGGEVDEAVYGGYVVGFGKICTAANNMVSVSGAPTFGSNANLYGGIATTSVGNILNLHSSGVVVRGVSNFQNINFYLPATMVSPSAVLPPTMETPAAVQDVLIATDKADISGVTVNVALEGTGPTLWTGLRLTLIRAANLVGDFSPTTGFIGGYAYTVQKEGNSLVLVVGAKQPGPTRDYTGQWFNASEDNWGLSIFQNFPGKPRTIFVPWYTYDSNGKAAWYVFQGDSWSADDVVSADVYRYTGPNWGTTPYDNSKITNTKVGTAKLTFTSATTVHFEYTVDGASRSVDLQKLQ